LVSFYNAKPLHSFPLTQLSAPNRHGFFRRLSIPSDSNSALSREDPMRSTRGRLGPASTFLFLLVSSSLASQSLAQQFHSALQVQMVKEIRPFSSDEEKMALWMTKWGTRVKPPASTWRCLSPTKPRVAGVHFIK
jgi:hypothetical protein